MPLSKARIREIVMFLLVGGTSTAIDAGVFLLLTWLGVWPTLASAISFMSAFAVNFFGNRSLVFRVRAHHSQLVRYVVLVGLNLGLSAGLVAVGMAAGLQPWLAKLISIVVVAGVNYVAMRLWVFRAVPGRPADSPT